MKQNKKKKHILIIAFAVIAILIVISQNNKEKGIAVDGGYPQRSTITESIPANGKIKPVSEIKISPDVSGEIIELNVKEGDKVKAGTELGAADNTATNEAADGKHLHFAMIENNKKIDPANYLEFESK